MSDRTAFYQAIWAAPDDDLPRMVFADWLDEHDDPDAAHFLRLLCACRTCPPDVDQLRPLVAQLRRTMVKLPPEFIENACPVHPAVVIGPWVDVDHEANKGVLKWLRARQFNTHRVEADHAVDLNSAHARTGSHPDVVRRVWEEIGKVLSPAAGCAIDGVPCLTDVWSGVVMAICFNNAYGIRLDRGTAARVSHRGEARGVLRTLSFGRDRMNAQRAFGKDWAFGQFSTLEAVWMSRAAAEFDPANRPV